MVTWPGFWETQRINVTAPWTWFCGGLRFAGFCLIVRHYMKPCTAAEGLDPNPVV